MQFIIGLGVVFALVWIPLMWEIGKEAFASYPELKRPEPPAFNTPQFWMRRAQNKADQVALKLHRINQDIPVWTKRGVEWVTPQRTVMTF